MSSRRMRLGPVLPVFPDEIKRSVFYIDETKAPGPDGYSAGFFKAAWPIVGGEVTQAILEFFATCRLLKQVNSTLISLIPKVNNPTVVAEYRPISCCNVLYKVITKILVQRMRGILDSLISPSQNAFVPGHSIGDNILLAQELFNGYNQQHLPPVCLKVCHNAVILSLSEWRSHEYFKGARGLRQGDPMSPYLFVLVMEVLTLILQQLLDQDSEFSYHWKCEAMQLFQLGFADDLLLFSKADTASVHVFKRALTAFADLSGLHANVHKSHLILSRSAACFGIHYWLYWISKRVIFFSTVLGTSAPGFPIVYCGLSADPPEN
ncbi:UNVERIFIED_CONTAM: LINE-1 reverse transcriptase [Sesamum latifolium]|uniref:LINE-1 reverse transcriptase n=1 Tax=Sesamum latifolium TaxID=2727402 RepID=A0AAW2WD00_9LAMI